MQEILKILKTDFCGDFLKYFKFSGFFKSNLDDFFKFLFVNFYQCFLN